MSSQRPSSHPVVPLGPERRQEVLDLDQMAFMWGHEMDPEEATRALEWDRTFGAVGADPGDLVGIYSVYSLGLTLPAGPDGAGTASVPMAGVSWVAVHPGHRRTGVGTAMLRHHLHGQHEAGGEAVSGLHASEAAIYGRFGYGLATAGLTLTLARGAELRDVEGADQVSTRFTSADPEAHDALVGGLYERACRRRPGMVLRTGALNREHLADPPHRRDRREPLRLVVAERAGSPTGYALLRRTLAWDGMRSTGVVRVHELVALDAATVRALWGAVVDFDLMNEVSTPPLAADDPLLTLLVDARAPRPTRGDDLWLRLVDVDRALAARSYARDVDVVLAVTDEHCPWNARRWRLAGGPGGATCTPTTDPADVSLDVRELGAAYAGGATLAAAAVAGLVREERAGAVAACSAAFRGALEPASPFMF